MSGTYVLYCIHYDACTSQGVDVMAKARVWASISTKGGCGKSMITTQIAAYAGGIGEKVVILDMDDPQYTSFAWHRIRGEGINPPTFKCTPEKLGQVVDAIQEGELASLILIDTPGRSDKT